MVLCAIFCMAVVTVITQALIMALRSTAETSTLIKALTYTNVAYLALMTGILVVFMM